MAGHARRGAARMHSVRLVAFRPDRGSDLTRHRSTGVRGVPLARSTSLGRYGVSVLHVEPGGRVGRHPAPLDQIVAVVAGAGWVSGEDGDPLLISAGQAVVFDAGEEHELGSDDGMTAFMVEADDLGG